MAGVSISQVWQRWRSARTKLTRLARFTLYLAELELLLLVLHFGFRLPSGDYLVGFILLICLLGLGLRWFRRVAMWRLRWRLVVAYVFIAFIPLFLLADIGLVAAYLFAGQFATYVVTSDLQAQLKSLGSANRTAAGILAAQVAAGIPLDTALAVMRADADSSPGRRITVWVRSPAGETIAYVQPAGADAIALPPKGQPESFTVIAGDERGTYLRSCTAFSAGGRALTVVASEPLDQEMLSTIAADVGEVILYPPNFSPPAAEGQTGAPQNGTQSGTKTPSAPPAGKGNGLHLTVNEGKKSVMDFKDGNVSVRNSSTGELVQTLPVIQAGRLAPRKSFLDHEIWFGLPFQVMDWHNGEHSVTPLGVRTRPSLLYGRLFVALGEFGDAIIAVIVMIAVIFAIIELAALVIGVRLTRTITGAVAALYGATQHVNRGDLSYRIKVTGQDQLANLETSFNSMTESLEKLIAEQKEKQRMESELAIAQEVQAQLFPSELSQLGSLEVHGVCRPARTVSGDYYDFLMLGEEKLGIAVGDISGKGISAALLMATIHSAVRVYEFGRMPSPERLLAAGAAAHVAAGAEGYTFAAASAIQSPASVLELLNRHLYHSTPSEKYATLFLAVWDGNAGRLTYSNGGHLPPLVVGLDGAVRRLEAGGTVIGLFDQMQWNEGSVGLSPGDLFVAYSDGITEPENEFGEFGEPRLLEVVEKNRHLPLTRITDAILASVTEWMGTQEQPDDLTVVLARAR